MKTYRIALHKNDPKLTLRLSKGLLKDLSKRALENGRDINVELAIRLSRSLENDLRMCEEDRLLKARCDHFLAQLDDADSDTA